MKTKSKLPAYCSVATTDEVKWKLELWRRTLSIRYSRRVTYNETIDYLLDQMGVPDDDEA
jgi:hypothetical protein